MVKNTALSLIVAAAIWSLVACQKQTQEPQVEWKRVQPQTAPFVLNELTAPTDPSQNGEYLNQLKAKLKSWESKNGIRGRELLAPVPYFDLILYSQVWCQADWNVFCEGDTDLVAPVGYQACKALYSISSNNGNTSFSVKPIQFFAGDTQNPPRFTAYRVHLYAHGSGVVFNQTGANINLANVGLRIIAADVTNEGRYETGCDVAKP